MGLLLLVIVHAADVSKQAGAKRILEKVAAAIARTKSFSQRLRLLWVDAGYQNGQGLCAWVKDLPG